MGQPKENQLRGTALENLGEAAGRVCYDSLGQGRSSAAYHEHILQVVNHSVYEHCTLDFAIDTSRLGWSVADIAMACINRKGIWLEVEDPYVEVNINFRAILEWQRHTKRSNDTAAANWLGKLLRAKGSQAAPMIFGIADDPTTDDPLIARDSPKDGLNDDQAMITLWLYGSRGFTHEQVRHRFAISQRSTRYVDEDGSPYIMHPLVEKFLAETNMADAAEIANIINESVEADRRTYRVLVDALQKFCVERLKITDKTAARKQARGAARGYLGNALASDMLFTTSVEGWKWILKNRKSAAADAEIRQIYTPALAALQSSQYGDRFAEFKLVPSPDGIGTVLAA